MSAPTSRFIGPPAQSLTVINNLQIMCNHQMIAVHWMKMKVPIRPHLSCGSIERLPQCWQYRTCFNDAGWDWNSDIAKLSDAEKYDYFTGQFKLLAGFTFPCTSLHELHVNRSFQESWLQKYLYGLFTAGIYRWRVLLAVCHLHN